VLVAVMVVAARDGETEPTSGSAQPLPRAGSESAAAVVLPEWTDVPVATSASELGPALSRAATDGLAAARARIARCVAVERRRATAPEPAAAAQAELVLRLAPRSGAVHVVGVEPGAPGAPELLADCARRQLDGDTFPAPDAVPGRRHRLRVTLP
jgi:hypothetical protein